MGKAIQNLAFFKAGWIACVILAALGQPLMAVVAAMLVVVLHLFRVAAPAKEALTLLVAALIGFAWESLMVVFGLIEYPAGGTVAPFWIVAMWALFATTINHGFRWMKRSWIFAAALGLIGGPLAFIAGAGLGAAQLTSTLLTLMIIGLGWAFILPLLCIIADTIIDSPFLESRGYEYSGQTSRRLLTAIGVFGREL